MDTVLQKITELEEHLLNFKNTIDTNSASIDRLRKVVRPPSYDGTLIWKIHNFEAKKANARRLHSNVFYTSTYGYKLRACVYFDYNGLNIHVDIIQSRNDYAQVWPFPYKVAVILFKQGRESFTKILDFTEKTAKIKILTTNAINYLYRGNLTIKFEVVHESRLI
jgi:hypothetical protein